MVDDPAAADLARARKLLNDLAHPSPALAQMVELTQRDPKSGDLSILGEKRERHRGGGSQQPGRNEAPTGSPRIDLRCAPRVRPVPPSAGTTPTAFPTLVADYADGLTQVQIAKKHRLHVQTVRKRLIEAGIDTRARLRVLADEDLRAARLAKGDGASFREIARGLGVAHTTVIRSLARRHEAPGSPLRTTPTRPLTSPTPVRPRRSPLRTTSEMRSDQDKREKQTGPGIEMPGPDMGSLRSTFVNLAPRLNTLVTRWKRGVYRVAQRPVSAPIRDSRGPVVRRIENLQTFLTASEVDCLVDDYRSGASVNELAERYGVHRATVSAHLTRRGADRRAPGLGVEEAAEAVKLHLGGLSMRAIATTMGVDRKVVRAALVQADVEIRR